MGVIRHLSIGKAKIQKKKVKTGNNRKINLFPTLIFSC